MKVYQFPKNFLWGTATAAHQVEGGNFNDWTQFEKKNAEKLAKTAKKRLTAQIKYMGTSVNWEKIKTQAENPQNYISGRACDHYHRFEEDFDLAKKLGHNAHRLSVEWARLEPQQGKFDQKEIDHYRNVLKALRTRQIEPFVTLWHFTLPVWIAKQGGWKNTKTIGDFASYVEKIVEEFKKDVNFWICLNEPCIYAGAAFLEGTTPPQQRNFISYFHVISNLIRAHKEAYRTIKRICYSAQIGIAKNNVYF